MNEKRIILIVIAVIIIVGLCFHFTNGLNKLFPTRLDKRYQRQLQQVCRQFCPPGGWADLVPLVQQAKTVQEKQSAEQLISQLRNKILDLRVSSKYKEAHLKLVIILSLLERGLVGEPEKIITAQQQLRQLLENEPWLSFN